MKHIEKKKFPIILFIIFLLLEVAVFLSHKVVTVNAVGSGLLFYKSIIFHPWVWISLFLALCQFFLWINLLKKAELSLVYSMSSLSYPLSMLAAMFVFNETISILVWIGGGLITLGVMLIGFE